MGKRALKILYEKVTMLTRENFNINADKRGVTRRKVGGEDLF